MLLPFLLTCQSFLLSSRHIFIFSLSSSHRLSSCLCFPLLSEIPAVSLCPPDSECSAEAQLTVIQSEGELCDSCSSLGRPSSSCQLYHQVCLSADCTVCVLFRIDIDIWRLIKTKRLEIDPGFGRQRRKIATVSLKTLE